MDERYDLEATLCITGGTGTFGTAFLRSVLDTTNWDVRILSRDELKQSQMRATFGEDRIRYLLGDVRDYDRCYRAFQECDYVVHAAALKRIEACEYDPWEATKTNILGTQNVITAALNRGVYRVIGLSTDKSVAPVNLYGATKLVGSKLLMAANTSSRFTKFGVVRYGNVVGSRGSVAHIFKQQAEQGGPITVTDLRMTRFWMPIDQAIELVYEALENPGAILVPKAPKVRIYDVACAIAPEVKIVYTGAKEGEKIHEDLLLPYEEVYEYDTFYRIEKGGKDGFHYTSETGPHLSPEGIRVSLDPWLVTDPV